MSAFTKMFRFGRSRKLHVPSSAAAGLPKLARRRAPRCLFEALEPRMLLSGSLFVTSSGYNAISEYTASGTVVNAPLITELQDPTGIAVSGADIFVTNYNSANNTSSIGEYTTSGATVNASLITGLQNLMGIAVSGSDIFVVNDNFVNNTSSIGEYTTSGATVNASLVTGLDTNCIAVSGSDIFVANYSGTIGEYTTSGATVNATLVTGLAGLDTNCIAVSGSDIFVANYNSANYTFSIGEYTTSGATVNASLVTGLQNPTGIAVSGSDIFVANNNLNNTSIIGEYTTSGATVNASLVTGLQNLVGIAVSGSDIFLINYYPTGTVGEYTTSGATVNASLVTRLNGPEDVAVSGSSTTGTAPTITGVSLVSIPGTNNWQITINGSGFGTRSGYNNNDSPYLAIEDSTANFNAGYSGDAVTANVASWTDSQIVISGLAGAYGASGQVINTGDELAVDVRGVQTGLLAAVFNQAVPPVISGVSVVSLAGSSNNWQITINGSGFGTRSGYSNNDSTYLAIQDNTGHFTAGYLDDPVTANVSSWNNTQIVVSGRAGCVVAP